MTFSNILDIKENFEMGLKLLKLEGSRLGFLIKSWITACLKLDGTVPFKRELFITDNKLWPTVSNTSFNRCEATMFVGAEVGFMWETMSFNVDRATGSKRQRNTQHGTSLGYVNLVDKETQRLFGSVKSRIREHHNVA